MYFTPEQRICLYTIFHKFSISSRIQEAEFEILSHWYRIPSRLHVLMPSIPPLCWHSPPYLLGVPSAGQLLIKHFTCHLVNAARACIPALWKQTTPATMSLWLRKIQAIMRLEDLTASLKDSHSKFSNTCFYRTCFQDSAEFK